MATPSWLSPFSSKSGRRRLAQGIPGPLHCPAPPWTNSRTPWISALTPAAASARAGGLGEQGFQLVSVDGLICSAITVIDIHGVLSRTLRSAAGRAHRLRRGWGSCKVLRYCHVRRTSASPSSQRGRNPIYFKPDGQGIRGIGGAVCSDQPCTRLERRAWLNLD